MNKLFAKILLGVVLVFLCAGTSFAATSVRLEQPQAKTYRNTFDITFVALDTQDSLVSVQCYKKGPSDSGFVSFGSAIGLSEGGNTDVCQVNSGVINTNGTYQFYVVAAGSSTVTSNTISIEHSDAIPAAPEAYSKTKPDNCTYKITFRTANDGKTVKVNLYRSTDSYFTLDSGHQVNSTNIGSDTEGSLTDNISPNCNTSYYYAIRAFDTFGNGSDLRGDSNVTTTTVDNPQTEVQGAIPAEAQSGNIDGTQTEENSEVLGTASAKISPAAEDANKNSASDAINWIFTHKKISLLTILILGGIGYYLYRRSIKK
jgi:hypothetical protein